MLYVCAAGNTSPDASAAVRRLLKNAFYQLSGAAMPEIRTQPGGKPDWPDCTWHFSLCHTRQAVFCAISDGIVGLDAEKIRPVSSATISRVLSPEELQQYDGSEEMFLRFWTLKEAYVKYTGTGLQGYPNKISFTLHPEGASLRGSSLCFASVRDQDWIISVCTAKPEPLSPRWMDLKE